jgi:hypothetical protein
VTHAASLAPTIVALALLVSTSSVVQLPDAALPFSCVTFPPDLSAADLRERFGEQNVQRAPVPWGGAEGDYNEGTVLFPDDEHGRLQIFWRDGAAQRQPEWVSVRGERSRWRTSSGASLGTHLQALERLNGRPFRLLGFATDVSGTVMSWSGGRLDEQDTERCRVRLRLQVPWPRTDHGRSSLYRQLIGERDFSSGHPAMQALDPLVYELFLQYR